MRRATRLRWTALRTAWLLVGAAIGLATVLVVYGLAELVEPSSGTPRPVVIASCIVPALLIGLLPGVRELEVTAARSLLGVGGDLVTPTRPRAEHRWRTMVLVTFHLGVGLLAAVLLLAVLPGWLRIGVGLARGRAEDYRVLGLLIPPLSAPVALLFGLGGAVVSLVAVWGLGRLAVLVAPRLLGATAQDRLEVALTRLEAESEHTRLARDLHDGIGHALTIISVQAAGGRKRLGSDPLQVSESLATIEVTARQALTELDDMLGLLRDQDGTGRPPPDLAQLPALLSAYRSAGLDLRDDVGPLRTLAPLVSTMAYRIVAEALTNAQRHGGPGPVRLVVRQQPGRVTIDCTNVLVPGRPTGRGSGHGLQGIAERVALFGGAVEAGPHGDRWLFHTEIPTGGHHD
ncbi:MAG: histidine kinase [Propionibacteriaceae bacterium]